MMRAVTCSSAILLAVTALAASCGLPTALSPMVRWLMASLAMSAFTIVPSAILLLFTAPLLILTAVTAEFLIVGFGYVPARSPPAGPSGGTRWAASAEPPDEPSDDP